MAKLTTIDRAAPIPDQPNHNPSNDLPRDLTVLILAGGQSSRMGQDKALIDWDGQPLLTRVCEVASYLSVSIQVLSPWPARYENIVPQHVARRLEASPGQGPLWALNQGLTQSQSSWILLLACDMPYLDAATIQQWRSQLFSLPQTCLAYVPQTQAEHQGAARWEPLCGFYRCSGQSLLQAFLDQGGRSFQQWLHQIEAIAIPIDTQNHQMFYNCNSPDDLISHSQSFMPLP